MYLRINLCKKISKKSRPYHFVGYSIAAIFALELFTTTVFAADVTGTHISSPTGVYSVHEAETLAPGEMAVGVETGMMSGTVGSKYSEADQSSVLDGSTYDLQRTHISFGLGLTTFLDTVVNVNTVSQKYDVEAQNLLFTDDNAKNSNGDFAGFTGLLKLNVLDTGMFAVSLAPFAEAGVGSAAKSSLARSNQMKAGWMSMLTLGQKGTVTADLNFGYRYRSREVIGDYLLKNELFYSTTVVGYITRSFGVFAGGQGRVLKGSNNLYQTPGAKRKYESLNSSEMSGGLVVSMSDLSFSLYGAQRLEDDAFGFAKRSFGAKVAYSFGGSKKRFRGKNFLSKGDESDNIEAIADVEKAIREEEIKSKKRNAEPDKPASLGKPYDYFSDFENASSDFEGGKTDRDLVRDQMNANAKRPEYQGLSVQEKRDAELKKIKDAEKAKKKYEEEQRKIAEKNRRDNAEQLLKDEESKYNEIMDDLQDDIKDLPEFKPVENDWDEGNDPIEEELFN